jgi:hypothetical protein
VEAIVQDWEYRHPDLEKRPGVYIFETHEGLVKVGITNNFRKRLYEWNRNHPIKRVIALFEIQDPDERRALELRLFNLFHHHTAEGYEDHFTDPEAIGRILLSKIYE